MLSVAAHPSGTAFATGGSDAKVKLWDVGARACVQTVAEHTDQVTGERFMKTFGEGFILFHTYYCLTDPVQLGLLVIGLGCCVQRRRESASLSF